jgi:hypothetical protein
MTRLATISSAETSDHAINFSLAHRLVIGWGNHCIFGCLLSGRELEVICIIIIKEGIWPELFIWRSKLTI